MNIDPKDLQFNDEGAYNVKHFGHLNVIARNGKTMLQSPTSGMIMPTDYPMGGEEIMRRRKARGE